MEGGCCVLLEGAQLGVFVGLDLRATSVEHGSRRVDRLLQRRHMTKEKVAWPIGFHEVWKQRAFAMATVLNGGMQATRRWWRCAVGSRFGVEGDGVLRITISLALSKAIVSDSVESSLLLSCGPRACKRLHWTCTEL